MKNHELIFVAFGSLGDIYPLLAVAKKMKNKHNVIFLANEYFRKHIEEAGVNYFPMGTVEEQLTALESKNSTGETNDGKINRFDNIIGKNFERVYNFLEDKVKRGTKMVVVSHGNLSPAVLGCERFNIPLVLTYYAPSQIPDNREDMILLLSFYGKNEWLLRNITLPLILFKSSLSFDIKPAYNKHREKYSLPPLQNSFARFFSKFSLKKNTAASSGLHVPLEIALLPRWFCEPIGQEFNRLKFAGFPFYENQSLESNLRADTFIAEQGKPIVFTPGTAVEDVEAFCKEMIPICRKLGSPGIFVSKHGAEAFAKLKKVDDVPLLYIEHADFAYLLPKSRCLIHHGGIGTMAQAIKAGIPQILRPRMYDQPANGVRVMMYGLGGSIAPSHYSADMVSNILNHIESNPKHRELLPYYSEQVNLEDGVENCSMHIEQYLNQEFYSHEETYGNSSLSPIQQAS
ncbi:MAG: nucleotide disphospho-sugar-binding domain-containing protein [Pseudomonadota bacterium]